MLIQDNLQAHTLQNLGVVANFVIHLKNPQLSIRVFLKTVVERPDCIHFFKNLETSMNVNDIGNVKHFSIN
jgi:hypothetical protein